jgi:hypothetical protein
MIWQPFGTDEIWCRDLICRHNSPTGSRKCMATFNVSGNWVRSILSLTVIGERSSYTVCWHWWFCRYCWDHFVSGEPTSCVIISVYFCMSYRRRRPTLLSYQRAASVNVRRASCSEFDLSTSIHTRTAQLDISVYGGDILQGSGIRPETGLCCLDFASFEL